MYANGEIAYKKGIVSQIDMYAKKGLHASFFAFCALYVRKMEDSVHVT